MSMSLLLGLGCTKQTRSAVRRACLAPLAALCSEALSEVLYLRAYCGSAAQVATSERSGQNAARLPGPARPNLQPVQKGKPGNTSKQQSIGTKGVEGRLPDLRQLKSGRLPRLPDLHELKSGRSARLPDLHELKGGRPARLPDLHQLKRGRPAGLSDQHQLKSERLARLPDLQQVKSGRPATEGELQSPSVHKPKRWPIEEYSALIEEHPCILTATIQNAHCWNKLQELVRTHHRSFNHVHLGALVVRMARFNKGFPKHTRAKIGSNPAQFEALEGVASSLLDGLNPWALSNLWYSFAVMSHRPSPELLQRMTEAVRAQVGSLNAHDLANVHWALSKLKHNPGRETLQLMLDRLAVVAGELTPQGLANVLRALAKFGHDPGQEVLERLCGRAKQLVPSFVTQDVSIVLWSLARLARSSEELTSEELDTVLLDLLLARAQELLPLMAPQSLSNTVWALGWLQSAITPEPEFLEACCEALLLRLERANGQSLSTFMLGLARLGHRPNADFIAALAEQASGMLPRFAPQGLGNFTWAFAKLDADLGQAFFDKLYAELPARLGSNSLCALDIANLLWAGAGLHRMPPAPLLEGLYSAAQALLANPDVSPTEISAISWGLGRLGEEHRPPTELVDLLIAQADAKVHTFRAQNISLTLWGLVSMGRSPSAVLLEAGQHMAETGETMAGDWLSPAEYGLFRQAVNAYAQRLAS